MVRKPTAVELGAFIRRHRLARGMTQGELGAMVGTRRQEICDYEKGHATPIACRWVMLCAALDAPIFVI
jgi:transcriptional regulator with XRE-family HTH domain